jgi:hypothetical protein
MFGDNTPTTHDQEGGAARRTPDKSLASLAFRRVSVAAASGLLLAGATVATARAAQADPGATSATASTATVNPATHNPRGTLAVTVQGRRLTVHGTATDPDTSRAVLVVVYINGRARTTLPANGAGSSYAWTVVVPYGRVLAGARALNVGAGDTNTVLGNKFVSIINPATRNPRGIAHLSLTGRHVTFTGIVTDPDAPNRSLTVRIVNNGRTISSSHTDGRHRFTVRAVLPYGTDKFGVLANNIGMGTGNPALAKYTMRFARPWTQQYQGAQAIAAQMVAARGWSQADMQAHVKLWTKESGWSTGAANPSGAYGIPQALPGSKMAAFGANWRTSATTQIAWGLNYIAGRYGNPCAAWAHSVADNWY